MASLEARAYSTAVVFGSRRLKALSFSTAVVLGNGSQSVTANSFSTAVVFDPPPPPPAPVAVETEYLPGSPPADQSFVVPANVATVSLECWGATGGAGIGYNPADTLLVAGGNYASGDIIVAEGDLITIRVGAGGTGGRDVSKLVGAGGWPDGDPGHFSHRHQTYGGGQGGTTSVLVNGNEVIRVAGTFGTFGYPAGIPNTRDLSPPRLGSNDNQGELFLSGSVLNPVSMRSANRFPANVSGLPSIATGVPGVGRLNADPGTNAQVNGNDGMVYVYYEIA